MSVEFGNKRGKAYAHLIANTNGAKFVAMRRVRSRRHYNFPAAASLVTGAGIVRMDGSALAGEHAITLPIQGIGSLTQLCYSGEITAARESRCSRPTRLRPRQIQRR